MGEAPKVITEPLTELNIKVEASFVDETLGPENLYSNHEEKFVIASELSEMERTKNSFSESEKPFTDIASPKKFKKSHVEEKIQSENVPSNQEEKFIISSESYEVERIKQTYNEGEKSFFDDSSLKDLIKSHAGGLDCHQCGKTFANRSALNKHLIIHTGLKPFVCELCNKCYTRKSDLVVHVRSHTGAKPYQCNQCDKVFSHNSNLTRHMRIHSGLKPYKCDECGKCFTRNDCLNDHIGNAHSGKKKEKSYQNLAKLEARENNKNQKPFRCGDCGKSFSQQTSFNKHLLKHFKVGDFKSEELDTSFTETSEFVPQNLLQPEMIVAECDLPTQNKPPHEVDVAQSDIKIENTPEAEVKVDESEIVTSNEPPYEAKEAKCDITMQNVSPLEVKLAQCELCAKTFTRNSDLSAHMRCHTGERAHTCVFCGRAFSHKSNLTRHMRLHTGDRPYKCEHCDKTFSRIDALNEHNSWHGSLHTCSHCGATFPSKHKLVTHEKKHAFDYIDFCETIIEEVDVKKEADDGGYEDYQIQGDDCIGETEDLEPDTEDMYPHNLFQVKMEEGEEMDLRELENNNRENLEHHSMEITPVNVDMSQSDDANRMLIKEERPDDEYDENVHDEQQYFELNDFEENYIEDDIIENQYNDDGQGDDGIAFEHVDIKEENTDFDV